MVANTVLSDRAKAATIKRHLVAISQAPQLYGTATPTGHIAVREVLKGILRQEWFCPNTEERIEKAELRP